MQKLFLLLVLVILSTTLTAQQSAIVMSFPKKTVDNVTLYTLTYGTMSSPKEDRYSTYFNIHKVIEAKKSEYSMGFGYQSTNWFNLQVITLFIDDQVIRMELDTTKVVRELCDSCAKNDPSGKPRPTETATFDITDNTLIAMLLKAKTFSYQYEGKTDTVDIVMSKENLSQLQQELKKLKSAKK